VPEQARLEGLALVGRDSEVALLRNLLDRSIGEPSTQLVSVIGEPGIGKSRLVAELREYVEELPRLITWRLGRSLSYGEGVAFWALGEIIKNQAGILESDGVEVTAGKLADAVATVIAEPDDHVWIRRHLAPLVGLEGASALAGESGRVEAFAAWRRFFEAMAEERPTVLVFEDIQWADAALLDFVDLLADRAGALPLLIVCTARPELLEQRPSWGGGKTNAMTISLSPLSADNTARLIAELLDQAVLPADVQQGLLARAEGNPLYAQEYVRMLQDRGLLVPEGRSWILTGAVDGLPESINGIIAARLDTLTPAERALMQDASVVGKTAWVGAVCSLSDRSPWEAEELVHALERRQLLHRMRRSTIQGEIEFSFGHALTRDVAYSQIRRADRATKHEAAAMWIERLAGDRDDKAELLADHYQQALQLLEQLDEDTSALAPRARAAFVEAAKQAAATYAYPAAARHYRAALRLTPADSMNDTAALLMGEAVALFNAGRADGKALQAVVDAQVAVGEWQAAAQAEQMLSRWYQEDAASAEDADVHLDRAAEYAARVPPSDVTFLIAYDRAFRLMTTGDRDAAYRLTSEMIPLAEQAGVDVGRAMMMIFHGSTRAWLGDAGGVEEMREASEMLASVAYPRTPVAYGNLGEALCGLGDLRGAATATAVGLEWALRLAMSVYVTWLACNKAFYNYHSGDWQEADRLLATVGPTNQLDDLGMRVVRGGLDLARGAIDAAVDAANSMRSYGETSANIEYIYYALALESRIHRATGGGAASLVAAERFLELWQQGGGYYSRAVELCDITPTLATYGRQEDIRAAALLLPAASRFRDALLMVAEGRYGEAADLYERIGSLPLSAEAHVLAARIGDPGSHVDAVRAFTEATGSRLYGEFLREAATGSSSERSA
jgi:hypothetical protein